MRFFNLGGILISDSSSTIKERGTQTSRLPEENLTYTEYKSRSPLPIA